ncbi:MAG: major capsid protein [Deltaproteobacteria bacterium]|nr:major capsid protein [Deltaproteobacteria bacterium]
MANPYGNDAFSAVELTDAVNLIPNRYGRINELGLFPTKGVYTREIMIDERDGVLTLLPSLPLGSPGTQAKHGAKRARTFTIPHIPHDDVILPEEYAGKRAFGSARQLAVYMDVMNEHLAELRNKHSITLEFLRAGALKGIITDASGDVIYNLFNEFGIAQKTVDFALTTETTQVRNKCFEVARHIEQNLKGDVMSGVRVLCSPEFFEALIAHPLVVEKFLYQESSTTRDDIRRGFRFGGLTFEEYNAMCDLADGSTTRFIAAGEAYAVPEGTTNTFATYFAPADFMEAVNTKGQEIYAKVEPRKFNRGADLHTQSNPLPLCRRPGVIVKLTKNS